MREHAWLVVSVGVGVFFLVVIAFGFGAAVGVSSTYDDFEKMVIPVLSMLGAWISGVGAFAAAMVSLWLAKEASKEDVEDVDLSCCWKYGFFFVSATSTGKRPSTIVGAGLEFGGIQYQLEIQREYGRSVAPVTLGYGQIFEFAFDRESLLWLAKKIMSSGVGGCGEVCIVVYSTVHEYAEPIVDQNLELLMDELAELSSKRGLRDGGGIWGAESEG